MRYKTCYLLDAVFFDGDAITGQIDGVAYSSLEMVEAQLGFKLPLQPTHTIDVNGYESSFDPEIPRVKWDGHDDDSIRFTVRAISVPMEEPQFDEYELRVIRNSLLAYHHVIAENHDESSYIYSVISRVEELQDKLSTMIEEIEEE